MFCIIGAEIPTATITVEFLRFFGPLIRPPMHSRFSKPRFFFRVGPFRSAFTGQKLRRILKAKLNIIVDSSPSQGKK
jgi:hypothetical protein